MLGLSVGTEMDENTEKYNPNINMIKFVQEAGSQNGGQRFRYSEAARIELDDVYNDNFVVQESPKLQNVKEVKNHIKRKKKKI